MKPLRLVLAALLACALPSCRKSAPVPQTSPAARTGNPRVCAANYPLAYFAQRIGGHEIDVVFPAPKDQDPAFWQPTDAQITEFQDADLIIMNGATYSKWAEKATLPESKIVDTSAPFRDKFITVKSAMTHSHGKQGEHSHDGTAFTTWIDFQQAIRQADAICEAMNRLKPEAVEQFMQNFDVLKKDILALDARMEAAGKKLANAPLVVSHPVYQYWARRYGMNIQSVLWEPEDVPTGAQMDELKKILAAHPAKWMIWEGEPATEAVAKLKAVGLDSAVFDPCANSPGKGDFLTVMRANVEAMERVAGR
jgi:zinc transport system substrate-binding protein